MDSKDQGANQQVGAYCPLISMEWLEERYGAVMAQTLYEEILRTDQKMGVANDIKPAEKVA